MTDIVAYNIPVPMLPAYSGRNVIVRSDDPSIIVKELAGENLQRVAYVQVLNVQADLRPLTLWGDAVPVDLVVQTSGDGSPFALPMLSAPEQASGPNHRSCRFRIQ